MTQQYIDKDIIISELEKLTDEELESIKSFERGMNLCELQRYHARMALLEYMRSFIDTIKVREFVEPDNDLDVAACAYVENWYNIHNLDKELYPIDVEISKADFKAGAQYQQERMMKLSKENKDSTIG